VSAAALFLWLRQRLMGTLNLADRDASLRAPDGQLPAGLQGLRPVCRNHRLRSRERSVHLVALVAALLILHFATVSPHTLRLGLQSAAIVALIAATFPMRESEARFMQKLANGKRAWVEVYRDSHDIGAAHRAAGLKISWAPETTGLQEKLDHLEARRLNLFKQ
jgi:hypothetical protein